MAAALLSAEWALWSLSSCITSKSQRTPRQAASKRNQQDDLLEPAFRSVSRLLLDRVGIPCVVGALGADGTPTTAWALLESATAITARLSRTWARHLKGRLDKHHITCNQSAAREAHRHDRRSCWGVAGHRPNWHRRSCVCHRRSSRAAWTIKPPPIDHYKLPSAPIAAA